MADLAAIAAAPLTSLARMRGHLFPFVPVMMGLGVALWFSLAWEPGAPAYGVTAAVLAGALAGRRWGPEALHALCMALACVALGFGLSGLRALRVDAPVLTFRYYGPVEGRVTAIDRSQSDQTRLTLDHVMLDRVDPGRTPGRVRVSLHGDTPFRAEPGMVVMTTALLSPPDGPVEPGGFDFRRMAWFDGLGAVGYTHSPVLLLEPAEEGALRVSRLRAAIRAGVEARIPGEPGAFSAALITGDRAGIGQATVQDLRDSNLAHLLAISGLHMGLLSGFVFAALRGGLALIPPLALRVPTKKVAAGVAMAAATIYLTLSGGSVATERAWVMVMVMLCAVLFDRRALSLRSVAIAAIILLALEPEAMLEPGFQMSFAATVALVAGFAALRGGAVRGRIPPWATEPLTLLFSSLIAGFATAPFAAAHFNRIAEYGLVANLMSVPVMGLAVMPSAVVAGLLAPLGWEAPALWVMEQGTRWILFVAHMVAGWHGSVVPVTGPPAGVLGAIALGCLWLILWRGRARVAGLVPVALAFGVWSVTERPPLLVASDGSLAGLRTVEGRAVSSPKGSGFAARQWLENDGDPADQVAASERAGFEGPNTARRFRLADWRIVILKGKGAPAAFAQACGSADLVILAGRAGDGGACRRIDAQSLRLTGALALSVEGDGRLRLTSTHDAQRRWSRTAVGPDVLLELPGVRMASMGAPARGRAAATATGLAEEEVARDTATRPGGRDPSDRTIRSATERRLLRGEQAGPQGSDEPGAALRDEMSSRSGKSGNSDAGEGKGDLDGDMEDVFMR